MKQRTRVSANQIRSLKQFNLASKPILRWFSVALCLAVLTVAFIRWQTPRVLAAGTITGTVYIDNNLNGARDTSGAAPYLAVDNGIGGVTVTAYDAGGTARGSAVSCIAANNPTAFCTGGNNGAYSLSATGTGPYRLEFTNLPGSYSPGVSGANNATTVRFVPDGNSSGVDLGIAAPQDYCQNNPRLCSNIIRPGNASGTRSTAVSFPYNNTTATTTLANESNTGATWGIAYQGSTKTVFASAMMKRHAGFGPLGTGGIYKIDISGGTPVAGNYVDVKTIGINTGADPRTTAGYTLPASGSTPTWDNAAYTQVGKLSIGDIDYDDQRNTLWFVNLADRRLHGITNVSPATTPTSANVLKDSTSAAGFAIQTSPAITCANGVLRPWAVDAYRGLVYVGAVCSGENTGATAANLTAYVLSFNPDSPASGFTQVISFPLNYTRTKASYGGDVPWEPWINADSTTTSLSGGKPQPILTDIEFDADGSLVMGLSDRWGDQVTVQQYLPDPARASTTLMPEIYGYGDILRFCKNGASFANPGTTQCPNNARPAAENGSNAGGSQGPGGGEFYGGDWGPPDPDEFGEIAHGGMAFLPGSGQMVTTSHDAANYFTNGIVWLSNTNGGKMRGFDLYAGSSLNSTNDFNKGNGIGDLELLCDSAPLQIGNRVWNDADGDGVQDAGATENGIANVSVQLWADTNSDNTVDTNVGNATTDANGNYLFGGANYDNMLSSCANSTLPAQSITVSANDAEQDASTTTVNINNNSLNLGSNTTNSTLVGLRFATVNIPRGAKIISASITFTASRNDTATPVGVNVQGEGSGNAAAFSSTNNNISSRSRTGAVVNWPAIGAWTSNTTTNAVTPNLSSIVQEIVNYGDWASGNAMGFIISNDGTSGTRRRRAISADSGANTPTLNVTYSTCPYTVKPNTRHEIRIPASNFSGPLSGLALTRQNADATANGDSRDSDATYVNGNGNGAAVVLTTGGNGQNNHTYDLGFKTGTVSLGNRVFFDNGGPTPANANNGALDAGESGLAGVTVELYDGASATLLATATTDANGYYSFAGLTSGTAYHVRLAAANFNTGGVLANYSSSSGNGTEGATTPDAGTVTTIDDLRDKGTTTGILGAGGYIQTRLAVTVTAAAAPTNEENGAGDANADNNHNLKVDFGLVQYSLGNRVWLDNGAGTGGVANDGILNGTEAGISGVSVSLFADADCNQAIDNTASPLATVTTDTNGYYRFDGLKAVCYIVRVNPANFLSGGVLAGRISSAGNVNAGSNSTDSRDNGIDPASHGTTGVLSNTINIGSKTMPLGETNPGGGYGPGATNGPAASDNSDDLTVDFGFRVAGPTAVELADFSAVSDGQTALLSWRSGSEKDNLGYNVYRRIGDQGEPVRLTAEPLAGSAFKVKSGTTLTAGDSYYYRDSFVAGAEYYLEAVGLDGRKQRFGPVFVKQDKQAAAALARAPQARSLGQLAAARENTPTKVLPPKALRASLDREPVVDALAQQRRLAADAHALRLGIRETGWYRVNGAQLRAAGLDPATDAEMLQLYADGEQLPMLVRTQAGAERGPLGEQGVIEFYAFGLDERETDTRVYWLAAGATPGLRFGAPGRAAGGNSQSADGSKQAADGGNQAAPVSFPVTAERKERAIYFSALTNGEDDENFFGAPVLRNPSSQNLELAHPDVNANGPARLEVSLQAATSGAHRVRVQFNGQEVGFLEWNGQAKHSQRFNVPAGILRAGANSVTLNAEADGDISLTDFLRLVYNRRYEAGNNTLLFTANARQRAEVTGFTTPDVRLFDLTDPRRAFAVAARMESNAGGYTLRVPAGANNRALLALGAANAFSPAFIVANDASSWNAPENGADLLIIAPAAFRQPAKTLAQTRSAQGLRAFAVNLEDIFDEYSGGAKRLAALRAFLRDARENWKTPPRYVLFLGDASYDPRNYLQMGAHDLVPTGWVATSYLETSSDESIVDFDGDGVGELALGRLPARTVGQAQLLVEKTLGYQPRPLAQGGALFIADQPDGYNFAQMNQDAAAVLPAGIPNRQWVRGTEPDPQFRQAILGALNQGPALVHYAGHGSVETWTGAGLLQTPDAGQFSNAQLSVYVMLTCLNGYFADETTESLAEGLLKAPNGGAAAVWASTGLTAAPGQQAAAREFYRRAFAATQTARLGDAAQAAKRATSDPEVRSTWTLFADPTLTLR